MSDLTDPDYPTTTAGPAGAAGYDNAATPAGYGATPGPAGYDNTATPAARPRATSAARICTILAFVFAAVAIFFLPPLFGLVALILGIVGGALGDRPLGWYAAAAGVVGGALGMVLAALLMNATN